MYREIILRSGMESINCTVLPNERYSTPLGRTWTVYEFRVRAVPWSGSFHDLGHFVMGSLVMWLGYFVMGLCVMGRFVMGRFVHMWIAVSRSGLLDYPQLLSQLRILGSHYGDFWRKNFEDENPPNPGIPHCSPVLRVFTTIQSSH
jgi:hypothetical protein